MAAEQRYMRSRHLEASKAQPGGHRSTDAQTDMQAGQLCSVVFDVEKQQRMHVLPRPVYAVSPDGQKATSFAFERLDAVETGECRATPYSRSLSCLPAVHAACYGSCLGCLCACGLSDIALPAAHTA